MFELTNVDKKMDTAEDYALAKAIVQSGQSDDDWDTLRLGKGPWPQDSRKNWSQYRKYSLDKLIEMMDIYKREMKQGDNPLTYHVSHTIYLHLSISLCWLSLLL